MFIKSWLTITVFVFLVGCKAENRTNAVNNSATNGSAVSSIETFNNSGNTNGAIFPEKPDPHQCEADGSATYSIERDEGEAKRFLPVDVWLLCPKTISQARTKETASNENEFAKVVLPPEAKTILENHWQYLSGIKKETAISEIVFNRNDNIQAIMKISIDAPNGKRPITRKEAEALVDFVEKIGKDGKVRKVDS